MPNIGDRWSNCPGFFIADLPTWDGLDSQTLFHHSEKVNLLVRLVDIYPPKVNFLIVLLRESYWYELLHLR